MDNKILQTLVKLEKKISNIEGSMVTKHDAKNFLTKNDAKNLATKDDLKNLATKDDVKASAEAVTEDVAGLITNLTVSMDKNFVHKSDFDNLEGRVKRVEGKLQTA